MKQACSTNALTRSGKGEEGGRKGEREVVRGAEATRDALCVVLFVTTIANVSLFSAVPSAERAQKLRKLLGI